MIFSATAFSSNQRTTDVFLENNYSDRLFQSNSLLEFK